MTRRRALPYVGGRAGPRRCAAAAVPAVAGRGRGSAARHARAFGTPGVIVPGGSLSEAYVHGFNLIAEGVRQVRGISTAQVAGLEHCLVSSGSGVPTSALILGADR